MTKKQEKLTFIDGFAISIILLVLVFAVIGVISTFIWRKATHQESEKLIDCYVNPNSFTYTKDISKEECEIKKQEFQEAFKEKKKISEEFGCSPYDNYCKIGYKTYIWKDGRISGIRSNANEGYLITTIKGSWNETPESKQCSPYADKKLSDLPVKCLDYFGIKK
mgnify:CR=1 FL=1